MMNEKQMRSTGTCQSMKRFKRMSYRCIVVSIFHPGKSKKGINDDQYRFDILHRGLQLHEPIRRRRGTKHKNRVIRCGSEVPEMAAHFRTFLLKTEVKNISLCRMTAKEVFTTRHIQGQ